MTDRSSSAYLSSILLHAGVIALIAVLAYTLGSMQPEAPKTFELVAGAGDNFGATAAPALGAADGIKLALPALAAPAAAPAPEPEAPTPAPPVAVAEAVPVPAPTPIPAKAPPHKPAPAKPADKTPILSAMKRAEMRAVLRQEAKDRKIAEAEKRKKMTEEEFRREHGEAKASLGIAGGVVGGSIENKTGGAGGKALTREEANELDTYFSAFISRLKDTFETTKPTDVSDQLTAKVAFYVGADGSISRVRILRSSGNDEFDAAALEAVRHTRPIGPRPDNQGDEISVDFAMHDDAP